MVKHCGLEDVGSNGNRCFFTLGWAKPAKPPARFNFLTGSLYQIYALHFIDAGYVHLRQDTVAPHRCNRYRVCCIMSETPGLSLTVRLNLYQPGGARHNTIAALRRATSNGGS